MHKPADRSDRKCQPLIHFEIDRLGLQAGE